MRTGFLTTVSAMALMATPAFAADLYTPYIPPSDSPVYSPAPMAVVGHLELGLGVLGTDEEFIFDDDSVGVFVGAGRANVPFSGGAWNLEIETGGGAIFNDGYSYSTIGAAGHLWTRLNSAALGAYGGVNFPTGATVYTLGVEGEAYFGAFTLGANTDYNWIDFGGGGDGEFWTIRGYADAYFNPNFRVSGELAYLDITSGGSGSSWSAGVNSEYRFAGSPFSVWGDLSYTSGDDDVGGDVWAGLLGFRVFMDGGMTLEQHDKEVPWESGLLGNRLVLGR